MNQTSDAAASVKIVSMAEVGDAAITRFVAEIPVHDMLFLNRDIREPRVLAAWRRGVEAGSVHSLVAMADGEVVATSAVVYEPLFWSSHTAEVRLLVRPDWRGHGVGRALLDAIMDNSVASGPAKLTARMTADQGGAIALFEKAGFQREALLRGHVRDAGGKPRDLAIFSMDIADDRPNR